MAEKREIMVKLPNYYEEIKNEKHVFIYTVGVRVSSTALQRILNSSNQICIYGEPHSLVENLLNLIRQMETSNTLHRGDYKKLVRAFKTNRHNVFYPNAMKDLNDSIILVKSIFTNIFYPINDVRRFGYKAISVKSIETFKSLKKMFPNSYILFLFRNPINQWRSIKSLDWWGEYYKDVDFLIKEYTRLSNEYMQFNSYFIEDNVLYDKHLISSLLRFLKIDSFDENLLSDNVGAAKNKKDISIKERNAIEKSDAWNNYISMRHLSEIFINKNMSLHTIK